MATSQSEYAGKEIGQGITDISNLAIQGIADALSVIPQTKAVGEIAKTAVSGVDTNSAQNLEQIGSQMFDTGAATFASQIETAIEPLLKHASPAVKKGIDDVVNTLSSTFTGLFNGFFDPSVVTPASQEALSSLKKIFGGKTGGFIGTGEDIMEIASEFLKGKLNFGDLGEAVGGMLSNSLEGFATTAGKAAISKI